MATNRRPIRDPRDVASAWFVTLEQARDRGDRRKEEIAIQQLARLGVLVTFIPPMQEISR